MRTEADYYRDRAYEIVLKMADARDKRAAINRRRWLNKCKKARLPLVPLS